MQIGTPNRVSGDPFASMFNQHGNPSQSGDMALDLFGAPGPQAGQTPPRDSTFHGPGGIGGVLAGVAEALSGGGGGGGSLTGGVGALGDFDPFQYVEASLAKMQNGRPGGTSVEGSGGLGQSIGSIAHLLGLGG